MAILFILMIFGCKKQSVISSDTKATEKVNVKWRDTTITVPGFEISAGINIDSLIRAHVPRTKTEIRKVTVIDPETKAQLSYWKDEAGRLQARCEAQEKQIDFKLKDIERIIKTETNKVIREERSKWAEFWNSLKNFGIWMIVIIAIIAIVWVVRQFR